MPKGASPKREREFKKLETEFKKEHRYPGREEEVAARIVNKQRAEHGESKQSSSGGSKQSSSGGSKQSSSRGSRQSSSGGSKQSSRK